jgi:hypothetical protein
MFKTGGGRTQFVYSSEQAVGNVCHACSGGVWFEHLSG